MRNKAQQSEQQGSDEKVVDRAKYLRATTELKSDGVDGGVEDAGRREKARRL